MAERYSIGSDVLPGLSKVVEEIGELGTILGKIIGLGGDCDHWDGQNLHKRTIEEMADVQAAIAFYAARNFTIAERGALLDRVDQKYALFQKWQQEQDPQS